MISWGRRKLKAVSQTSVFAPSMNGSFYYRKAEAFRERLQRFLRCVRAQRKITKTALGSKQTFATD